MNSVTKSIGALLGLLALHTSQASIILSGNQSSSNLQALVNRAQNIDGTLYQGFGSTSFPGTNYINGFISGSDMGADLAYALAVQPDGKILLGGYTNNDAGYQRCALARFMPNGQLDTSFGVNGSNTQTTIPGTVFLPNLVNGPGIGVDRINAIVVQSDGKIVVGIYSFKVGASDEAFFALARFNSDGSLDTSFGNSVTGTTSFYPGSVVINQSICEAPSSNDVLYCLALQSDQKIVVGGNTINGDIGNICFVVARFLENGSLDESFDAGTEGNAISNLPGTVYIARSMSGNTEFCSDTITFNLGANNLAIQKDGSILLGGYTQTNTPYTGTFFVLASFSPEGPLSEEFGVTEGVTKSFFPGTVFIEKSLSGTSLESGNSEDFILSLALQPDGKIVAAGNSYYYIDDVVGYAFVIVVARFNPDGSLDASFGVTTDTTVSVTPGVVCIRESIGGASFTSTNDYAFSMSLQNNGSIVIGSSTEVPSGNFVFGLAKLLSNGQLDSSFGAVGENIASIIPGTLYFTRGIFEGSTSDQINSSAILPDGSIIVGGFTNNSYFAIAKFFNPQNMPSYKKSYSTVGAGLNC